MGFDRVFKVLQVSSNILIPFFIDVEDYRTTLFLLLVVLLYCCFVKLIYKPSSA